MQVYVWLYLYYMHIYSFIHLLFETQMWFKTSSDPAQTPTVRAQVPLNWRCQTTQDTLSQYGPKAGGVGSWVWQSIGSSTHCIGQALGFIGWRPDPPHRQIQRPNSCKKRPKPASWRSDPVANIHHSQWFQPVLPYPLQPMDPIALILQEGLVKLDSTFEFSGWVCLI